MGYTRTTAIPITFPAGSTETTIEVHINNDQLVERTTEQFTGRIISGGGISDLNIFASHATVDIMDNDGSRSTLSLSLSVPSYVRFFPSYTYHTLARVDLCI